MIRSFYRAQDGSLRTDLRPEEFTGILADAGGFLWVDLTGEPADSCEPILRDTFGFHPLAIEDALKQAHVPKVDDWGHYLYLVLHAVVFDKEDGGHLDTLELDVFVGKNYVVTHHEDPIAAVERVWTNCARGRDERHRKNGASRLLYDLADELVADFMPAVEEMDEAIDLIEDQVFARPAPATLERIFTLKRAVLHLQRIISPQREVLNKLARDDYAVIDARNRIYFRDVYDHLVRLHDFNESLRDLVGGALDTYLSVINNRMNEVMKTLTIITTLFMPISFVTGFFGMNFFQPATDVWTGKHALVLTLAAMVLIPVGMYLWIRRRGWM